MPISNTVISEFSDGVQIIRLNRPERGNAFNTEMVLATIATLEEAGSDRRVRCVLLTGSGAHFSTGQDLGEAGEVRGTSYQQHLQKTYNPLILRIRRLEKPVLGALKGTVAGAALGVALACDLRIASDETRFKVGFLNIGLAPDTGVSLLLPTIIGLGRATEMTFTDELLDAEVALEWGLINRIAPEEDLYEQSLDWAKELAQGPLKTIGLTKLTFNKAILLNLVAALDYEAYTQEIASHGAEHREGLQAFLENRAPRFTPPEG